MIQKIVSSTKNALKISLLSVCMVATFREAHTENDPGGYGDCSCAALDACTTAACLIPGVWFPCWSDHDCLGVKLCLAGAMKSPHCPDQNHLINCSIAADCGINATDLSPEMWETESKITHDQWNMGVQHTTEWWKNYLKGKNVVAPGQR